MKRLCATLLSLAILFAPLPAAAQCIVPPNGAVVKTANYTALAADTGKLFVMNCSSACTLTLPSTPQSPVWQIWAASIGSATATLSPNGLTLDGVSGSVAIPTGIASGMLVMTDNTNYFSQRGVNVSTGVNSQTGAGYTVVLGDFGKVISVSNASAQNVTLPAAAPFSGWYVDIQNTGAGTWTVSRNGLNIDGGTTNPTLQTGQGIRIVSDASNYFTQRGSGMTPSSVDTKTNLTLDAEGTGNVATRPFYISFSPACNNATDGPGSFNVPTSAAATFTACSGTTATQGNADFVDAATSGLTTQGLRLPDGWVGAIDMSVVWYANAASANAVRWQVSTGCVADGEAVNTGPTFNTASATNSAYTGTALQRKTTTQTSVSVTNCAAGETIFFKVERVGADAGDTLTATAELIELQVKGRTTK